MSHNKLYRNFIILQEDERGHSTESEKSLSGYAKVEAKGDKCKISFYAQNLRKEDNYSMVLICCKRDFKELIDLGVLTINDVGKGDTSKEYYINNIAGLGISYEKISGAAICKSSGKDLNVIMHGFMNGEEPAENWRKFKLVKVESPKDNIVLKSKKADERIISSNDNIINSKVDDIIEPKINENIKAEKVEAEKIETVETEIVEAARVEVETVEAEEKSDSNIESVEEKIAENILSSDERHKCKKCDKEEEKKKKHEEHKKDDKKEECKKKEDYKKKEDCKKEEYKKECKEYSTEQIIDKLCEKIEDCDYKIDFDIRDMNCDYMVYGFIKKHDNNKYQWKKFKLKRSKNDFFYTTPINKRVEENTKLDLELDMPDFEKYESDIKKEIESSDEPSINGSIGQYFEKIAQGFEIYDDKLNDINNCKWYRVNVDNIDDLCNESDYNKYTLAYYPMINYYPYVSKSNHFLLGYKCNEEGELQYIIYGIAGSKDKEDQPYGGKTGFVTWTNSNNRSQGYWLMFYDFRNSSIVVPMKK